VTKSIKTFALKAGQILSGKYQVVSLLGSGWEGEVYKVREIDTNIERAAKIFFPYRNKKNKTLQTVARKLHKLQNCDIVFHYHTQDTFVFQGEPVIFMVSEFVAGELLFDYIKRQRGKRLSVFKAVHLLHALCVGIEEIHKQKEFHGDLHPDNVVVCRLNLTYKVKLLDLKHNSIGVRPNQKLDVTELVRLFYDMLGGQKYYSKQPDSVKQVIKGLKKNLILSCFKSVRQLREYLEEQDWS